MFLLKKIFNCSFVLCLSLSTFAAYGNGTSLQCQYEIFYRNDWFEEKGNFQAEAPTCVGDFPCAVEPTEVHTGRSCLRFMAWKYENKKGSLEGAFSFCEKPDIYKARVPISVGEISVGSEVSERMTWILCHF